MTTITIELSDEQAERLASEAQTLHTTTEALAARKLAETLGEQKPTFQEIARQVIQENTELYRRLA